MSGSLAVVVLLPLRILGLRNSEQDLVGGSTRLAKKPHARALQKFIALKGVALATGDHHVVPGIKTASASRNNVVDGKFPRRTAVLALALIPRIYHRPRRLRDAHFGEGQPHKLHEPYDFFGDDRRFLLEQEDDSPLPRRDVNRLVRCVKHQYLSVNFYPGCVCLCHRRYHIPVLR